jgi:hypothetical protein
MDNSRRSFLERTALGAVAVSGLGLPIDFTRDAAAGSAGQPLSDDFDLTWVNKVTGKHKVLMDVAEVDSGYGIWRSNMWSKQYMDVLGAKPNEMSTVLVMRHNGINLAMQQAYWDKYGVGKATNAMHPITAQPTDINPALMTAKVGGLPAAFDGLSLADYMSRGGIALGCNVAFGFVVANIAAQDKVSEEDARKKALTLLIPGVMLQPSGIFACVRAQEAGCAYIRAS